MKTTKEKVNSCLCFCIIMLLNLCNVSCNGEKTKEIKKQREIKKINFFLDNSASMKGYMYGSANFAKKIPNILVAIENNINKLKPININYISKVITPYPKTTSDFNHEISTHTVAIGRSSEMHKMFENIINQTDSNDISLFVSDCILSFPDEDIKRNPEINKQKADGDLMASVNSTFAKAKNKICATVYGFNSDFYGTYFFYDNTSKDLHYVSRPYYLWVIGNKELLIKFREQLKSLPEFNPQKETSFGIYDPVENGNILFQTEKVGIWQSLNDSCLVKVESPSKSKPIKFAIAVNLATLPSYATSEEYLSKNLKVTPLGTITIKKVEVVSSIQEREKSMLKNATHVFIVTEVEAIDKIHIELPMLDDNTFDEWSTNDDKIDFKNKTFALKYLLSGVNRAYHNSTNDQFINISITLKR